MKLWLDAQFSPALAQWMHLELNMEAVAVRDLATSEVSLSKQARSEREALLSDYEWVDTERTTIISIGDAASWWTFGGGVLNSAIAPKLGERLGKVRYDNFALYFKGQRAVPRVIESIRVLLEEGPYIAPPISEEVREKYKFGECVPGPLLDSMIAVRFSCEEQWSELRRRDIKTVYIN
jgi:hypothetical protein